MTSQPRDKQDPPCQAILRPHPCSHFDPAVPPSRCQRRLASARAVGDEIAMLKHTDLSWLDWRKVPQHVDWNSLFLKNRCKDFDDFDSFRVWGSWKTYHKKSGQSWKPRGTGLDQDDIPDPLPPRCKVPQARGGPLEHQWAPPQGCTEAGQPGLHRGRHCNRPSAWQRPPRLLYVWPLEHQWAPPQAAPQAQAAHQRRKQSLSTGCLGLS